MKDPRSIPIRCPRGRFVALFSLAFLMALGGAGRLPSAPGAESARPPDPISAAALLTVDPYGVEVDPYGVEVAPIDGGRLPFDPGESDDLLDRDDDGDVEKFDIEFMTVEEGGSVEVGENHIEVPPFALSEDTWMALYVPVSGNIEYWAYPPDIQFNLPVELRFSYKHADSTGVNEQNITIDQWLPQFQLWDIVGGVVDTLSKRVTADVMEFPAGVPDSVAEHARFALADHN